MTQLKMNPEQVFSLKAELDALSELCGYKNIESFIHEYITVAYKRKSLEELNGKFFDPEEIGRDALAMKYKEYLFALLIAIDES
jgi:hypothetical protein